MNTLHKIIILLFIFLGTITLSSIFFINHYQKTGPAMLTETWQMSTTDTYNTKVDDATDTLSLHSSDKKSYYIRQSIKPISKPLFVLVKANIRCRNVIPGNQPWERARLIMTQFDGTGAHLKLPHVVASIKGSNDWKNYSRVFKLSSETKELKIAGELIKCTGSLWIKNIELYPVIQTALYTWLQKVIFPAWGIFFILLLGSCLFKENKLVIKIIFITSFIAIIVSTTIPGEMRNKVTTKIKNQIQTISKTFGKVIPLNIPKIGHLSLFTLFGLALSILMSQTSAQLVLVHIILLAGGSELVQFCIESRTPMIEDFFINVLGGILGISLFKLSCKASLKKQKI